MMCLEAEKRSIGRARSLEIIPSRVRSSSSKRASAVRLLVVTPYAGPASIDANVHTGPLMAPLLERLALRGSTETAILPDRADRPDGPSGEALHVEFP
jgi:hypothetical protein